MRCAYPDKHYLLLGNCPGCNPEGYAALFPRPLEPEDEGGPYVPVETASNEG